MGAASAWAQTTGTGVTVAVLDSGVDLDHPDLAGALWTDPATGAHGVDLVDGDLQPDDAHGHGTHVAGLIAARASNGIGSAGIAPTASIMAVRVLDERAAGDARTVADGVRWAVAHGARILNLSLAGPVPSRDLEQAIADAREAGVLVVAAAGNQAVDLGLVPAYPAASASSNVLAVAATDPSGALTPVSNFAGTTDLAAPGELLISTAMGGGSELRTGTSMAAPLVAGTAALVLAARPDADFALLEAALLGGARPSALPVGRGTLDAAGALRHVIGATAWRAPKSQTAPTSPAAGTAKAKPKKRAAKRKRVAKKTTTKQRKRKATRRRAATRRTKRAAARSATARARGPVFRAA